MKKAKKVVKRNPYNKRKHIVKRKGKRGRPKKVIGSVTTSRTKISKNGKKRGRPKKVIYNIPSKEPEIQNKPMRILKFAGHCPSCQLALTTEDIKGDIYTCNKCAKTGNIKELIPKIEPKEIHKSKKEYLQTVNSISYEDLDYQKPLKDEEYEEVESTGEVKTESKDEKDEKDENEASVTEPTEPIEEETEDLDNDPEEGIDTIIKTDEELLLEKELKKIKDDEDE